ncbi:S8 family serine peptidase [Flavobacterium sp.]|uniref:S8 family serine peptidase n=1 Tax=Flavobacterium sp. TaxID=239 RepID=UPI002FDA3031
MVIGKKELISTDLKYFTAIQGIDGRTLFQRYNHAESNITHRYIDSKYQNFLAHPVQDNNTIVFHGKKYVEIPQLLNELEGENYLKYVSIKEQTIAHYKSKIEHLRDSGKNDEAQFLSNAIKYIDDRFIYCYDDIVVLGIWGMKLRENIREDINEICKHLVEKKKNEPHIEVEPQEEVIIDQVKKEFEKIEETENNDEPENTENPIANKEPWYRRFWNWLKKLFTGRGCLRWLLWLLLILLLLLLFFWLFRNCSGHHLTGGAALSDNDSTWVKSDPRVRNGGGIYDPYNPYNPVPTPPEYEGILPPNQGVLPPLDDNKEIIPGNPTIIGNRLNILMENENLSVMDFAKDFKVKYPDANYKVVYYDDVVKRLQIEFPSDQREILKKEIPEKFKPKYNLFVFDESLFEGNYKPNDPIVNDNNKNGYLNKINAFKAWDISQGSEKITIAIVDNGFNLKHPELRSKVIQPYNVWKHSNEVFPLKTDHGTHVAGIALAIADNGKGISGIAPNCKFMPVQVANEAGVMTTTSVLDGILFALYQGADVINVSLGTQFSGLSQFSEDTQMELIQNHFKEEERLWREVMRIAANHNATLVIAAGNDNVLAGIDALQRPELFITVAATATHRDNQSNTKANFSNYGSFSKISAPGEGIYSSIGLNDYKSMDGTSMAAPIIAGAVALMKSINDKLTTKEIICILQNTGLPTQGNIGNLIQLDKALLKVKSGDVVDCTPIPSTGDVQILLKWNNYNDLDLYCTDPNGEAVWFKNKRVSSGGKLEIDMNVEYPDSKKPIENIYWPNNAAPNGTYNVYVIYYKIHEPNIDATSYTVSVKYGSKTEEFKGSIKKENNAIHIGSFTLESDINSQRQSNTPNSEVDSKKNALLEKRNSLKEELERVERELKEIGVIN